MCEMSRCGDALRFACVCTWRALPAFCLTCQITSPRQPWFQGRTPLHHAVEGHHQEMVELLVESGADLVAQNDVRVAAACSARARAGLTAPCARVMVVVAGSTGRRHWTMLRTP